MRLDARSRRVMPWKNGGGTTTEIARSPAGETLDDFDWRVSMARVEAAGPFSRFAGVDRSLAVVEGESIELTVEGRGPVLLDRSSPPFAFAADIGVSAALPDGPIEDFNVMTRRGRYRHLLTRMRIRAETHLAMLGEVALFVVSRGAAVARRGDLDERLAVRDALLLEAGAAVAFAPVSPGPEVELLVVDLWRC